MVTMKMRWGLESGLDLEFLECGADDDKMTKMTMEFSPERERCEAGKR